jgi:predicted transcriptional regulator
VAAHLPNLQDLTRGVSPPGRSLTRSDMSKTGSKPKIKKTGYTHDSQKNQSEIQELKEINAKIQELKKFHAELQPVFEEFRTKLKKSHDLNKDKDDIYSKIDNINKIWDTSFGNNREIVDIGEFQSQSNAYLNKTEEVVMYLKSCSS